jgi:hypothetical protein
MFSTFFFSKLSNDFEKLYKILFFYFHHPHYILHLYPLYLSLLLTSTPILRPEDDL